MGRGEGHITPGEGLGVGEFFAFCSCSIVYIMGKNGFKGAKKTYTAYPTHWACVL